MTDANDTTGPAATESTDNELVAAAVVPSTYKVLGDLAASDGVGVLGRNTATSGDAWGVVGVTDSPAGYGLATPDDAKVEGVTETPTVGTRTTTALSILLDDETIGRYLPTAAEYAPNVVVGHPSNAVEPTANGVTIAGGGFDDGTTINPNGVFDDYGTIGGGRGNTVGDKNGIATTRPYGTVAGGLNNAAGGRAAVGGGDGNQAVGGQSTIGGGNANTATRQYTTVGGGSSNDATDFSATVGGGFDNAATGGSATAGGGYGNAAAGTAATVAGGERNDVQAAHGTIAGGGPSDSSNPSTNNVVFDEYGTIGGGGYNRVGSDDGVTTNSTFATVGGGYRNTASGAYATVGGGYQNTAGGFAAAIPGGYDNTADGSYAFVTGRAGDANGKNGAVVFADSSTTAITAQNGDEVRSQMPIYAPAFNNTSARAAKTDVDPVDPGSVLERVASLEVATWTFRRTDDGRHMGPMAGDFHDAFGLGEDPDSIATVDADGVLFAAVQALTDRDEANAERIEDLETELDETRDVVDERDDRIEHLETENDRLREHNDDLEARLEAVEDRLGIGEDPEAAD